MLKLGIVSVTFRPKTADEIVEIAKRVGLDGIEWGSDIHVKPGDIAEARRVGELTRAAGLEVASYGSYYYLEKTEEDFTPFLDSAAALGAPNIRVWTGVVEADAADDAYWSKVIENTKKICRMAEEKGITISTEFHVGTLTHTLGGTLKLLNEVGAENLFTYWQPPFHLPYEQRLSELKKLYATGKISNFHVHYAPEGIAPLSNGKEEWKEYFGVILNDNKTRYANIEFVFEGKEESLVKDIATIKEVI